MHISSRSSRLHPLIRLALLAGMLVPGAAWPDAATAAGELALTTERVVVFKDGHALFVKRAEGIADGNGAVHTNRVPDSAVLGTFWATAGPDRTILSMNAEWVETVEVRSCETPCVNLLELLRVNVGETLTAELVGDRTLEGELAEVLELPLPETEAPQTTSADRTVDPYVSLRSVGLRSNVALPLESIRELKPEPGTLVVLDTTSRGRVVLPIGDIRSISGEDLTTRMERRKEVTTRSKRLSLSLGEGAAGREVSLRLLYFTPGMRWIPTYRVGGDLIDDAEVALQGEILNEVENIEDAALDLVVGVPNFRFKEVVSPMVLEKTLRHALREAAPSIMGQQMMSNTFSQRSGEWRGDGGAAVEDANVMTLAPELGTSGTQDLFVYGLPAFSLNKGARATVGIWHDRVDIRHLYTLDLRLVRHGESGATFSGEPAAPQSPGASPLRLARHRVWHQIELANSGNVPWTTGAALLLQGDLPLGQDLLTYTPVGGASLLPVTVAVDVRGGLKESEIERTPDALIVDRTQYTLVRKRGEIPLANYKDEPITVRVRLSLGGRIDGTEPGGDVTIDDFRPDDWESSRHAFNNHSDVEWTVELGPGESKTLSYFTSFYVR